MRVSTAILEGRKIPRGILSIRPPIQSHSKEISSLMGKAYEVGVWCYDLPSLTHLQSFKELKHSTEDDTLIGLCHLEVEAGISLMGKPLHRFESNVISTIKRNLFPSHVHKNIFPTLPSSEVFTQKEIDRIAFDPLRFEKAISLFNPEVSPFLFVGERYGDWMLALGRIDLLKQMIEKIRKKGFTPIFSGQWATFVLPRAKSLEVAAYGVPINKKWSLFDLTQACDLIKKFDKPVISLNPLADGELLGKIEEAFSFLFEELKIHSAIIETSGEEEMGTILKALEKVPSLIPHRKT